MKDDCGSDLRYGLSSFSKASFLDPSLFSKGALLNSSSLDLISLFTSLKEWKTLLRDLAMIWVAILPTDPSGAGLVLWLSYASWHDGDKIVFTKAFIGLIQDYLAFFWMFCHSCLQVVTNDFSCDPADELKHMDITLDPRIHLHIVDCQII